MKHLYSMTNDELVRFANERGVQIVTSDDDADGEYLIERDELADLPTQVPRFEDLAPEIRNLIYEELLCFKEGQFTCFPEILRTNKKIHEEACSILYGKNDINVQLSNDGIIIQDRSSNDYVESRFGSRPAHTRSLSQRSVANIEWPEYLRRARSLRFSIIDSHTSNFTDVRKVSTENVLHSLCAFLCEDHKLQALSIDLRRRDRQNRVVAKTSDLYCLLLLTDKAIELEVEGDGTFKQLATDGEVDLRTIGRVSMSRCREFNDECLRFAQTGTHTLTPRDQQLLLKFTRLTSQAFDAFVRPTSDMLKLGKKNSAIRFGFFIDKVRDAMEQYDIPLRKPSALIDALDKILHFDIDVQVARLAALRLREEMEADE